MADTKDTSDATPETQVEAESQVSSDVSNIPDEQVPSASIQLLKKFAEDAYYLHSYGITTGKKVPENVTKTIIQFKQMCERSEKCYVDADLEVRFSSAYQELAAIMYPVTVESLRDTEEVQFHPSVSFFKRFRFTKAQQVALLLPVIAIFLILTILACEIVQSIFIPGLREITTKEEKIDTMRAGIGDNSAVLDQIDGMYKDIHAILKNLEATWENVIVLPALSQPGYLEEDWTEDPDKVLLMKTRFAIIVEALNRLLPVLYGALGATAYLLRVLIPHITNRTFNKKHAGSISVRICLGMLSGVAIQWFFGGGEQQAQIFERSLSTSALAFLAGYSVDLLFNIMDRFVQAIKPSKSSSQRIEQQP